MEFPVIDWSKSAPELYEEIRRYQKNIALYTLTYLDRVLDQLRAEDIFNHADFKKIRARVASQRDWGELVGVSAATIGNYERNITYPNKAVRKNLVKALEHFRGRQARWMGQSQGLSIDIDPVAAKEALENSILDAALTDFRFDSATQKVVAVPFDEDLRSLELQQIDQDRRDLLESLGEQAQILAGALSSGANANVGRMVEALKSYARETEVSRSNPPEALPLGTKYCTSYVKRRYCFWCF